MNGDARNRTAAPEFMLEGFPAVQHLGKVLFSVHLLMYLASVAGNTLIITITWADHHLQTPMYFFLSSFSFLECYFKLKRSLLLFKLILDTGLYQMASSEIKDEH